MSPPVPPPTSPGWSPTPDPGGSRLPRWVVPGVLVVALVAVSVLGTSVYRQRQEIERLRADLAEAEARIAELEAEGGGFGRLFGDLFGPGDEGLEGLLDEGLEGLLDGLFDRFSGGGGMQDLLGDAGIADLSRCLVDGGGAGLLAGGDPIVADDLSSQIAAVADRVEALRGLEFREPVDPELLPSAQFTALVTELVLEDYTAEDAEIDRRVLSTLGAVDEDVDLRTVHVDLVGEQAAGFYDTDTGELVIRADDAGALLGPAEQVVLAHELQHAVADQSFGLPDDPDDAPADSDADRGGLALIEGDATLFMQQFTLDALGLTEQLEMALDPSVADSQQHITGYPEYLQRQLLFPYTEGMAFVCGLYADGGWDAVDAAYADLPTTTAQILWPERYSAGEGAVDVAGLGAPAGSWSERSTATFGAAELLWLFSAPGDDAGAALDDPRGRAAAWAGGRLTLWTDGGDSALGIALAQRAGEAELCDSMTAWYDAAFPRAEAAAASGDEALAVAGPDGGAVIVCAGDAVRMAIAPDLPTARQVVG